MLDNARKYVTELKSKFMDVWYDEKYKYYFCNWHNEHDMDDNDWTNMYFASVDKGGNVLGYIAYSIDRGANYAHKFGAINFSDDKLTFGKDLCQVIDDIFCKFNFQRMEFDVVCGNPIEKSYDRMVEKYGGRVIGIRKRVATLMDNKLYDSKSYEILREDYLNSKNNKSTVRGDVS